MICYLQKLFDPPTSAQRTQVTDVPRFTGGVPRRVVFTPWGGPESTVVPSCQDCLVFDLWGRFVEKLPLAPSDFGSAGRGAGSEVRGEGSVFGGRSKEFKKSGMCRVVDF